jgi:hypothetical protein
MSLQRAMAVLAERWQEIYAGLDAGSAGQLRELAAQFVAEGDQATSFDMAADIMNLLRKRLPAAHPVRMALAEREDRLLDQDSLSDRASRAAAVSAWFRLAEPLRARLGIPAPTVGDVMRESSERLLAAPALTAEEVLHRGHDPSDPDLVQLDRGDGTQQWPVFQFEPHGGIRDVVRAINRILVADEDPFGAADWWLGRNGLLGDAPARLIGHVPDDLLIAAARGVAADEEE